MSDEVKKTDEVVEIKIRVINRVDIEVEGDRLDMITNGAYKRLDKQLRIAIKKAKRSRRADFNKAQQEAERQKDAGNVATQPVEKKPKLPERPVVSEADQEEGDLEQMNKDVEQAVQEKEQVQLEQPKITLESLGLAPKKSDEADKN